MQDGLITEFRQPFFYSAPCGISRVKYSSLMSSHKFICRYNLNLEWFFIFRRDSNHGVIHIDLPRAREITLGPGEAFEILSSDFVIMKMAVKQMERAITQIEAKLSSAKSLLHIFRLSARIFANQSEIGGDIFFIAYGKLCLYTESQLEDANQLLKRVSKRDLRFGKRNFLNPLTINVVFT